jgi:anthranilate synthase/aminodeoxychorismate synthase-like glutamine amidotransferase
VNGAEAAGHLLLVDNQDSFTYNLAQLLGTLGTDVRVVSNDDRDLSAATVRRARAVVIGPGPGRPRAAGKALAAVGWATEAGRPLLGVCLGLQAIGEFFGGRIEHAPRLVHGKVSAILHDGTGVLRGVPSPFPATRYHSLCLASDCLPATLRVNAVSEDGVVQSIAHEASPVYGLQFHPESVLTTQGATILANFLAVVAQ